jgi:hypothetical protein
LCVRNLAAEPNDLTIVQHDLDTENVIGRDTVGERVRPSGIIRDIAADRASGLAARIGRIKEAVFGDRPGKIDVDDARFDDGNAVL